jgi:hypothetical protein
MERIPELAGTPRAVGESVAGSGAAGFREGVSTRRVDELLHIVPTPTRCSCGMSLPEALGLTGIDTPALPAGHPVRAASPGPSGRDGRDEVVGGARESRVSRTHKGLGEVVEPFRNRPLEGQCPFLSGWMRST